MFNVKYIKKAYIWAETHPKARAFEGEIFTAKSQWIPNGCGAPDFSSFSSEATL